MGSNARPVIVWGFLIFIVIAIFVHFTNFFLEKQRSKCFKHQEKNESNGEHPLIMCRRVAW
jgi:hypothetical protein